ncbi:hypothetical protein QJS66_02170 [Kocuria rhizophila]|nr:hypothetical protein QJS66_02170 [Kocuria rhizophila]
MVLLLLTSARSRDHRPGLRALHGVLQHGRLFIEMFLRVDPALMVLGCVACEGPLWWPGGLVPVPRPGAPGPADGAYTPAAAVAGSRASASSARRHPRGHRPGHRIRRPVAGGVPCPASGPCPRAGSPVGARL